MTAFDLPRPVVDLLESSMFSEFATVSGAGVPIDTPTYFFPDDDLSAVGVATGLSYPAKAERARRNPKVGLLIEGLPGEPVVAIRGMAAVRDANLQANAERYIAETGFEMFSYGLSWGQAKQAVWYLTRIIIEVTPEKILWWDNADAMERPPHVLTAPAGTVFPQSDPAPPGKTSPASQWEQRSWQDRAKEALASDSPAHLTLCDADGFPLPIRAREFELVGDRFRLVMPRGAPWSGAGKATLTFRGLQTFVGEATVQDGATWLAVERTLPEHPLMKDPVQVLQPSDEVKAQLLARLGEETRRRGQSIPTLPDEIPAPTRMARLRKARFAKLMPGG